MNKRIKLLIGRVLSVFRVSSKSNKIKLRAKNVAVGFDANTFNDMFQAKAVYDRMKGKCHPDRFAGNPAKQELANEIFQQMVQNKTCYAKLLELEKRMNEELLNN